MSTAPVLNSDAIQALRDLSPDGDAGILQELVTIYLNDTPKQMAQLEEALARQDAPLAARAAHTIKGSSSNFGAEEFSRLANQIEAYGKSNNLPAAAAALPEFKASFAKVAGAMQQLISGA